MSTTLREGDDPIVWLRCELPTWTITSAFRADSPTQHIDGISISAPDPLELVERVRAFERMVALAAGRSGRLPVGRPLGGLEVDAPKGPPALRVIEAPKLVPTDLGAGSVEQAKRRGYTGAPCSTCGSLDTRYAGRCLVCDRCGSTSGGCS